MPKVEVPLFLQPHPDYCVPTCIKMVLESLRNKYGNGIPLLSIKIIAKAIKTIIGEGTSFDFIHEINARLLTSVPSVKFLAKFPCKWDEVIEENNEGKPIIAWIWLSDSRDPTGEKGCGHSVVITDIDVSLGEIFYNDPLKGLCKEDIGTFISKWEHEVVNQSLIKVEIEDRAQRYLPEYSEEVEEEET